MIESHPTVTERLSEDERKLLPLLISFLAQHKGKKQSITSFVLMDLLNKYIASRPDEYGKRFKIAGARLRKMINHLRIKRMITGLCGTESGYFLAENPEELKISISSLEARASAILAVKDALKQDLEILENPMRIPDSAQYSLQL